MLKIVFDPDQLRKLRLIFHMIRVFVVYSGLIYTYKKWVHSLNIDCIAG